MLVTLSVKLRLTEQIFENFSRQRYTKVNKFSLFFAQFHVKIAEERWRPTKSWLESSLCLMKNKANFALENVVTAVKKLLGESFLLKLFEKS